MTFERQLLQALRSPRFWLEVLFAFVLVTAFIIVGLSL